MKVETPTTEQLRERYPEDEDLSQMEEIPTGIDERLKELAGILPDESTVTLARDWEGMPFAFVSGVDGPFDVLAFTDTGKVGMGGVNLPVYHDTVEDLLESRKGLDRW